MLSRDEVAHLLNATTCLKHQAALSVAYGAGLRVAEISALISLGMTSRTWDGNALCAWGSQDGKPFSSCRTYRVRDFGKVNPAAWKLTFPNRTIWAPASLGGPFAA